MLSGPPVSSTVRSDQLLERFLSGSPRQRRSLLPQLESRWAEVADLAADRLDALDATGEDWAGGCLLQLLLEKGEEPSRTALLERYSLGWLAAPSASGIDYAPLQLHLMRQEFEAADRLTSAILRQLAGAGAERRGYVYYSEVPSIAGTDLESLDRLWICYSRGRFGFSVQGRLLEACGGQWERLWPRLGWKQNGVWTRYPSAFTWSIEAPEGHMPLINQLRGVRLMDALLRHPSLRSRILAAGQAPG